MGGDEAAACCVVATRDEKYARDAEEAKKELPVEEEENGLGDEPHCRGRGVRRSGVERVYIPSRWDFLSPVPLSPSVLMIRRTTLSNAKI